MMVMLIQHSQYPVHIGRDKHQIAVESITRHRNDRVRLHQTAGLCPSAVAQYTFCIHCRTDYNSLVSQEGRRFHHSGKRPLVQYRIVIEPKIKVLSVRSCRSPGCTHSLIPEQRAVTPYYMCLRIRFRDRFRSSVRASVIDQIYGKLIRAISLHRVYLLIAVLKALEGLFTSVVNSKQDSDFQHQESSLRTAINAL